MRIKKMAAKTASNKALLATSAILAGFTRLVPMPFLDTWRSLRLGGYVLRFTAYPRRCAFSEI
ncbi:MAG: hypothetical protein KAG97_13465, partial [Victivallales bacterium]|nr:hypothetical protein [Victivallales bacterium]